MLLPIFMERLPLGSISGGIAKFVTVALGILANPKGTVIVDEFESGFYYRDIAKVWKSLVDLCKQEQVQMVASTHSYEFLEAAAPILAAEETVNDSQLLRAEINADGEHVLMRVPSEALKAATAEDFEVR